ncbi:serine protease [Aneurinibacillus aneurinilyticus]|uniref:serine protease n=1 Tax=Aneurinibacillus aneurinilyticus TaxID=1391 RepID=UPI002E1FF5CD|nr:serine protease [Aneurinibacillus aneurinilyticus]
MNYFIISQDERIFDAIEPTGVSQVITREQLEEEQLRKMDKLILQFSLKEKTTNEYVDFIQRPIPLLSDQCKQIIEKYVPHMHFKSVVLVDRKQMRQDVYWLIAPPRINCLSDESEFHKDGTIKRLVIDEQKAISHKIFRIDGILEDYILISLDVAESLLRRNFTGIRLKKVEKEGVYER